jgi:hypothetical protein
MCPACICIHAYMSWSIVPSIHCSLPVCFCCYYSFPSLWIRTVLSTFQSTPSRVLVLFPLDVLVPDRVTGSAWIQEYERLGQRRKPSLARPVCLKRQQWRPSSKGGNMSRECSLIIGDITRQSQLRTLYYMQTHLILFGSVFT